MKRYRPCTIAIGVITAISIGFNIYFAIAISNTQDDLNSATSSLLSLNDTVEEMKDTKSSLDSGVKEVKEAITASDDTISSLQGLMAEIKMDIANIEVDILNQAIINDAVANLPTPSQSSGSSSNSANSDGATDGSLSGLPGAIQGGPTVGDPDSFGDSLDYESGSGSYGGNGGDLSSLPGFGGEFKEGAPDSYGNSDDFEWGSGSYS